MLFIEIGTPGGEQDEEEGGEGCAIQQAHGNAPYWSQVRLGDEQMSVTHMERVFEIVKTEAGTKGEATEKYGSQPGRNCWKALHSAENGGGEQEEEKRNRGEKKAREV